MRPPLALAPFAAGLLAASVLLAAPRASLKPEAAWYLKGGLISAGLVPSAARAEWPPWMQALCGKGRDPGAQELARTDLRKVPDVFLAATLDRLRTRSVFTPELLAQASAIGYVADSRPWLKARTAYLKAYLAARPLPAIACPQALSALVAEGEAATARRALEASACPVEPALRASYLHRLELHEGRVPPADARSLPAAERFLAWRRSASVETLSCLLGTEFFDEAVHVAVSRGQLPLSSPMVDEAIRATDPASAGRASFLVREGERASDLLWMRAADALQRGARAQATAAAREILQRFPDSWYAGHAAYLLRGAGEKATARRLKVPGDITLCNAEDLGAGLRPPDATWPAPFHELAARGRFDLILGRVDPGTQADLFLRAAHAAGQMDLVARHFAVSQDCSPANLASLYPLLPAAEVERLVREEGAGGVLDAAFVLAVIKNESQFQPSATSGARAMGLMQLLRGTFRSMAGRKADIRSPEANIRAGIRYLARVARTADLHGEPELVRLAYMVAGYHAGEGRARRWHAETRERLGSRADAAAMLLRAEAVPFQSTRQYVLRVLGDRVLFLRLLKARR